MVRRFSKRPFLAKLIQAARAGSRIDRPHRSEPRGREPLGNRLPGYVPRVRRLEPRFVLNASAELNALGQLMVIGTAAPETVQLGIGPSGDLLLLDELGSVIPINNHPDGVGFENNPLDPAAIVSGEVIFEMGGSRDILDLQLPTGLDVTVVDGGGDDLTTLRFEDNRSPDVVSIDSETIWIERTSDQVSTGGADLQLQGSVFFGSIFEPSELSLESGSLDLSGRLVALGDLTLSGQAANVDLSDARLTALTSQTDFVVNLQNLPGADFSLGGTDGSAGALIEEIEVQSAAAVSFVGDPTIVTGSVTVSDATTIDIDADIDTTGGTQDGDVSFTATDRITIDSNATVNAGQATIVIDGGGGIVDLAGGALESDNSGDAITIQNASEVTLGDVTATSGLLTLGVGQDITGDTVQATAAVMLIDRLAVSSIGAVDLSNAGNRFRLIEQVDIDGNLLIQDSQDNLSVGNVISQGDIVNISSVGTMTVGSIEAPDANVRLFSISINDAMNDTAVDLVADRAFLIGPDGVGNLAPLEVSVATELNAQSQTNDIVISSTDPLPIGFVGAGSSDVRLTAASIDDAADDTLVDLIGDRIFLIGPDGIGNLAPLELTVATELNAESQSGDIVLSSIGALPIGLVDAGVADVRLTAASIDDAADDTLDDLIGDRIFLIGPDGIGNLAPLEVTVATELNAESQSGDIVLSSIGALPIGLVDAGVADVRLTAASINDAADDTLVDLIGDRIFLVGPDGIGNLAPLEVTVATELNAQSQTGDIVLSSTGALPVGLVDAGVADLRLTATSINDAADDTLVDIVGDRIFLVGPDGIGNLAPLEVTVATELNAQSQTGDIVVSSTGALPIGLVDAGVADVRLTAASINDGADDSLVDLIGDRIFLVGTDGVGNLAPLEVTVATELNAQSQTGDIVVSSTGALPIGLVDAGVADVRLTAASINDGADDSLVDLIGDRIFLVGTDGVGNLAPLEVAVATELNAESQIGDIVVSSTGALPIGLVDAGVADVRLTAASINDATDDTLVDLIGNRIFLVGPDGVGNLAPLEVTVASELNTQSQTGDIVLSSTGALPIGVVDAGVADVRLTATSINDAADDTMVDVVGDRIFLVGPDGIGNLAPLEVAVASELNAESQTGDIVLSSTGALPIGLVDASLADVRLTAASINDATDDTLVDLIGNRIFLVGPDGIGNLAPLEVTVATELIAESQTGDIVLSSTGALPIGLVDADMADVRLTAASINDAAGDTLVDLIGDRIFLVGPGGIGNLATLEVTVVTELNAESQTGDIVLSSTGALPIGLVDADMADVRLTAASINDAADDTLVDIVGDRIFLNGPDGIGNLAPLEVTVATELNAESQAGDIVLSSTGALPIGLVDAGVADVRLTAASINDAADDVLVDLIGDRIFLSGPDGIGNLAPLEVTVATELNAESQTGDIVLSSTSAFPIGLIDAGVADVRLTAASIDDAADDTLVDIVGDRVFLVGSDGVGNFAPLEVTVVSELNAESQTGDIVLSSSGALPIGLVDAGSFDVRLTATSINDAADDILVDLIGDRIFLIGPDGIGNLAPLEVTVATELNAESQTGDIVLSSTDALPIGLIDAGVADVRLTAASINDAADDILVDLIGDRIFLIGPDGIGNLAPLEVTVATELNAESQTGDIVLSSTDALPIGLIDAGVADVRLTAASINDAADDILVDLIGDRIFLIGPDGIGNLAPLEVTVASELNAESQTGDIVLSSTGALPIGLVDAGVADVRLTAASINDAADDTLVDLIGDRIFLIGPDGIGNLAPLEVTVATELNAQSQTGDIVLSSTGAMPIGLVDGGVADVRLTAASINDATDDTLVDIVGDRIFLVGTDGIGNLAPLEVTVATELNAQSQTGDIVLSSTGALPIGLVDAGVADVRLTAASINDAADGTLVDLIGDRIFLVGPDGIGNLAPLEVTVATELNAQSQTGDIVLSSTGAIPIGLIDAGVADVRLTAASINDAADDTLVDLIGDRIFLVGPDGIGNLAPLEVTVATELNAQSQTGDIVLSSTGALPIGLIDAGVADVRLTAASINDAADDTLVDLIGDRIFLVGPAGVGNLAPLEVTVATELNARSQSGDIVLSSTGALPIGLVDSGVADVRLIAASINDAADDTLVDLIGDRIFLVGPDGIGNLAPLEVTVASELNAQSQTGDIVLSSTGALPIGLVDAGVADVRLTAASINDAADDSLVDIAGDRIFLVGPDGIGNLAPLEVTVATELNAQSQTGDIVLSSADPMPIGLVDAGVADVRLTAASINDAADDSLVDIVGDRIFLVGPDGIGNLAPLEVTVASELNAESQTGDIVLSSTGALPIGLVDAGSADVRLTAASINDAMDDAEVDLIGRRAFLIADTGIGNAATLELLSVAELTAISQSNDIVLSHLGDEPIELSSVIAVDGAIRIDSVGTIHARDVQSQQTDTSDGVNRDIELRTSGVQSDILVTTVIASGGSDVLLDAGDDIRNFVESDGSFVGQGVLADDLQLIAQNKTADSNVAIELSTTIEDLQAAVFGVERGDMLIQESDDIRLAASDAMGDEIIETSNGEIIISAGGNITIVDSSIGDEGADLTFDPELVARGPRGRIDLETPAQIELQDDVQIQASLVTNEFSTPTSVTDPSESTLQRSDRALFMKSNSVVFGEQIEINTGPDQGVARFFAPIPVVEIDRSDPDNPKPAVPDDPDLMPAFFDPFTVDTTVLQQVGENDASGVLTIEVGRTGERGLTVDIDWGAGSEPDLGIGQFQQLNGLSADQNTTFGFEPGVGTGDAIVVDNGDGTLEVEHFYTQQAILESRENGRDSSTAPLEVRFSVRHHDSIYIEANEVTQAPDADPTPVVGMVVSSTDNPATLPDTPNGLENGQASFIIPSLSIPVAFFPVRDVIPELEIPEFVVTQETVLSITQDSFETIESSVSSSVSREEYFQIRVLSPDPDGDDLADPQRLPDDILTGDKIQRLFQQLPDGAYEIEYVVGDGSERPILRVDVRDGEATIPNEPLEAEQQLQLEAVEESSETETPGEEPEIQNQGQQEAQPVEGEQPNPQGAAIGDPQSQHSIVAGGLLATTLRRRFHQRKRRLSVSGRFASRNRVFQPTQQG